MKPKAYYNEIEPYAVQWLRNLIDAGLVAPGDVDDRDIRDVRPSDLAGYTQCHFFAGIGGWSYALRLAGWPDDRPVWTGSCPCQPFSAAGRRVGFADERHLWPHWFHLVDECRPATVFGEQVASKDGLAWFATVHADLEAAGYAVGGGDLCAAGVGAPHIRQRTWFVADADGGNARAEWQQRRRQQRQFTQDCFAGDGVADTLLTGRPERWTGAGCGPLAWSGEHGGLAHNSRPRLEILGEQPAREERTPAERGGTVEPWANADWLLCRDGKARPVEPGTFPRAHGIPARVGRLRAYGNAIVPHVAATFIAAYCEAEIFL